MSSSFTEYAAQLNSDGHYTSDEIDDFRIFTREWFGEQRVDLIIDSQGIHARAGSVEVRLKPEGLADPGCLGSGNRGAL